MNLLINVGNKWQKKTLEKNFSNLLDSFNIYFGNVLLVADIVVWNVIAILTFCTKCAQDVTKV